MEEDQDEVEEMGTTLDGRGTGSGTVTGDDLRTTVSHAVPTLVLNSRLK